MRVPDLDIGRKRVKNRIFGEILIFVEISESVEVSTGSEISTDSENRHSEVFKSGLGFFISHFVRFLMLQGHFPLLFFAHEPSLVALQ